MANPSNLTTLRLNNEFNVSEFDIKNFINNYLVKNSFDKSLKNKDITIQKFELSTSNGTFNYNLYCYFSTKKINSYKKLLKGNKKRSALKKKNIFSTFFSAVQSRSKLILFSLTPLNVYVDADHLLFFYQNLRNFKGLIFGRKLNLFYDFLKISSLFINLHVSVKGLLYYISQSFCFLQKKKHNSFLFFLKTYLQVLISSKNCHFTGIKFILSGKISGKTRSGIHKILLGSVPLQSLNKDIQFSKSHVYTVYGAFGLKLWISKK